MATKPQDIVWAKNRGRNGWDPVFDVGLDQSVESLNVHLYDGGLGTRRGGSVSITITGVTGPINALIEYIPGQDLSAAELFVVDGSATTKILRCAAGSTFTNLTLADNVASEPYTVSAAVLNGKLYLAYDSTVNRLHVFDPGTSTTLVRRSGMGITAAPTAANTGAGAYAATLRYYRTRLAEIRSGLTIREGEASPAVSFTPSGAGTAARVSRPSGLNESETHWVLMGSTDDAIYYDLSTIAIGTTTFDDSVNPSAYASTYTASPTAGSLVPFPSVKCLGTDGNRLYGFGVWETTAGDSLSPKNGRFYFGPVIGASVTPHAVDDDERINNSTLLSGWIDVARNSGAADRGCTSRPVNNVVYAFQSVGIYGFVPTESPTQPYRREVISSTVGNMSQQAIVMATDRLGRACCFFIDPIKGPYTVGGSDGLRWCGKDLADLWATITKDASVLSCHGLWHPDRDQVWFFVGVGTPTYPNTILVLDVTELRPDEDGDLRGGWTVYDGDIANTKCAVMFSNTLAAARSRVRVPYTGGVSKLLRYDESVNRDDTTTYLAYVRSGAEAIDAKVVQVNRAYLAASAQSGVSVRQSLIRNTGDETARTSDVVLTAVGSETTVLKKFENTALQDAWCVQVQLGDAAAQNVAWSLLRWWGSVSVGADL